MTDPSDYTARIRAKGLDTTGVTEQLAAEMYRNKGRHYMVIAEVKVDETHEKADGNRKVDLILTLVEPATDSALEEHLRELTRVGYLNRQQSDGQLAIDQSLGAERTVADVLSSGGKFKPHPFLPVDASVDDSICDVCGVVFAAGPHTSQDVLDSDEQQGEDDETQDLADPYDFVHAKGGSLPGEETICALHATVSKSLHTHDDHDQVTCPDCREQLDIDASFHGDNDEPWDYPAPEPLNQEELEDLALTSQSENGEQIPIRDPFTAPTT